MTTPDGMLSLCDRLRARQSVEQHQLHPPVLLAALLGVVVRRGDRLPKARRREPVLVDVVLRGGEGGRAVSLPPMR